MPTDRGSLTDAEIRNGYTPETIAQYQRELEDITSKQFGYTLRPGNVVTMFQRPRPAIRSENALVGFNPFRW